MSAMQRTNSSHRSGILAGTMLLLAGLLAFSSVSCGRGTSGESGAEATSHGNEDAVGVGSEVALSPEALEAAAIEIEEVTERMAVATFDATGTVELNQEQTQSVTPLVSGRVERVMVALGDTVRAGQTLAIVSSPEIAQMHGKLHEAETRVELAIRNLERVERAENRAAVLSAKARLDEAEAAVERTQRLIDLGAGAGKDLIAAETAFKTAKAEYEFESNIALNKEIQEARAELETARVDASHIRSELASLGVAIHEGQHAAHDESSSQLVVAAPIGGAITERLVNAGSGISAGQALFTISNLSTVWVIANVPSSQIDEIRNGAHTEIRVGQDDSESLEGTVDYIDPRLDESTRTARVRIEVPNPGGRLKTGMFVHVGFAARTPGGESPAAKEIVAPEASIQRLGERTVVFVPADESGRFEVRDVETGGEIGGYRRVVSGLSPGDRVVTKGSFTLKTQLMKSELGEHE